MSKLVLESEKQNLVLLEHERKEFSGENLNILDEDKELLEFLKDKEIEIIQTKNGLRVSTGGYIGSAEFSRFRITVNPKFTDLKNIGRLIDYGYNIKDEDMRDFEIKFHEEKNQPLEIIVSLFVNHCYKLLRKGLYKSYVIQHDTVPYLRGKLLLQEQIQNEAKFNLKFSCEYDEFTSNNIENQILLYCMDKCYHLTESNHRKKMIHRFIHHLDDEVQLRSISLADFQRLSYSKLNQHYKKPHKLAELILRHLGVLDFKKQRASFIVPYFVPMHQVFENFLTQLFYDYSEMTIEDQVSTNSWFVDDSPRSIIPDIVMYKTTFPKKGSEQTIIDAKYMTSSKFSNGKEEYQIAFYLNEYKLKTGFAVLPYSKDEKKEYIRWHAPNQDIEIFIKFVNIDKILDLIYSKQDQAEQLKSSIKELMVIPK